MLEERSIWKKWRANCRIFSQIHKEEERFSTKEESPGKEKNYRGEGGRGFFLNKKNKKMVGQQSWALDRILKGDAFGVKRKCIKIRDVLHLRKVSIFFLLYSSCFQQKAYVPPLPFGFQIEGAIILQNNATKHWTINLVGLKPYHYTSWVTSVLFP